MLNDKDRLFIKKIEIRKFKHLYPNVKLTYRNISRGI